MGDEKKTTILAEQNKQHLVVVTIYSRRSFFLACPTPGAGKQQRKSTLLK